MFKNLMTFMIFLTANKCFADELIGDNVKNIIKQPHTAEPNILSTLLALVFVVCLIYITGIIYSKLNVVGVKLAKKQLKDIQTSKVFVHSTTSLGNHRNLYIIEIDGQKMLIGASQNSIALIKDLSLKETTEENLEMFANEEASLKPQNMDLHVESESETTPVIEELKQEVNEDFGLYKKYL